MLLAFLIVFTLGCSSNAVVLSTEEATLAPTDTRVSLPDLVIGSIQVELTFPGSCSTSADQLQVIVSIENRGNQAANPFVVQLNQSALTLASGLAAGEQSRLIFPYNVPTVTAWVDATYQVQESAEDNNQQTAALTIPALRPDCLATSTPDSASSTPLFSMQGHTGQVKSVAFSPDGKLVASGSVDNTMRLWEVSDGELLRTMQGHPFPVLAITFSPNGTTLATGSSDSVVRIWRVTDGQLVTALSGHAGKITSVDYSPDGRFLASASEDYTVRLWRLLDNRPIDVIDEGMSQPNRVVFSPDGKMLAWGEQNGKIRIWRISDRAWMQVLSDDNAAVTSLAYSPDGSLLAAGYTDGSLRIWRPDDGRLLITHPAHAQAITGLAFSPDNDQLLTGSRDQTLRLWTLNRSVPASTSANLQSTPDVNTQDYLGLSLDEMLTGHTGAINGVAFSPDGTLAASGGDDNSVRLWQLSTSP